MKKIYVKWLVIWVLVAILLIVVNKWFKFINDTDAALILGCLSIAISILSLGYTDLSKKKFEGVIHIKLLDKSIQPGGEGKPIFNQLNYHIINLCGFAINNFTVTFRFPNKIYYERSQNHQHFTHFRYGETVLASSDVLKFIGSESGYNDVNFEHFLNLCEWKKGHFMVTISGDNIEPTTYCFRVEELNKLKAKKVGQMLKYEVVNPKKRANTNES
jgi:hypothetical protein